MGGYLFRERGLLSLAFFMTITSNALALLGPLLSGFAVDAIEPGAGQVDFERVFFMPDGWLCFMFCLHFCPMAYR